MKKGIARFLCIFLILFGMGTSVVDVNAMEYDMHEEEEAVAAYTEAELATNADVAMDASSVEVIEISGETDNAQIDGDCEDVTGTLSGSIEVAPYSAGPYAVNGYVDVMQAAVELREAMTRRENPITLYFTTTQRFSDIFEDFVELALQETNSPVQGDYLKFHCGRYAYEGSYYVENGFYYNEITFEITYLSTKEQESELDSKVQMVLSQLDLYSQNEYEKIKRIYQYITKNVSYNDAAADLIRLIPDVSFQDIDSSYWPAWTAYGALCDWYVNGKSYGQSVVCQGYATLFYRLAREAGLSVRVISGSSFGESHGWNIVRINDKYYNLDTTWDAGKVSYSYFLKGTSDFYSHTRDDKYCTSSFYSAYPMSQNKFQLSTYVPPVTEIRLITPGDTNLYENETITLSAIVIPEGTKDTIIWTSSQPSVATVDAYGNVTAKAVGKTIITATSGSNPSVSFGVLIYVNHKVTESIILPTCTQTGTKTSRCEICDAFINSVPIPALGHSYVSSVVAPTYEANGYTEHSCSRCGNVTRDTEVERLIAKVGWILENSIWSYIEAGVRVKGWLYEGSDWYYLDDQGFMKTGWLYEGADWYYLTSSGAMKTGWLYEGADWYYLTSSGAMKTGWLYDGGKWYYLTSSGAMATGWLYEGGTWYYLTSSGAMVTGRHKIGNRTYRFNLSGAWIG